MELIKSPWKNRFQEFGSSVHSSAIIVAPFIGAGPLKELASSFDPTNPPTVDLLTNLGKQSLMDGTVDVRAIVDFCESVRKVRVGNLPRLHAKVYIADDHLAIVTSGNLTQSSLDRNSEYGIAITEKAVISQLLVDIREYWSRCKTVSLSELARLAEWQRMHRQKFRSAQSEMEQTHEAQLRELDSILLTVKPNRDIYEERFGLNEDVVMNLRGISNESDNAVFARTTVYLLGYGPLPAQEIDSIIQTLHPERCDDSIINEKKAMPRWKHRTTAARKWASKDQGTIQYDSGLRLWRLA